jgi:hypothetical protein
MEAVEVTQQVLITPEQAVDGESVGEYVEQWCALCERPITYKETLHPAGLQVMDFGCRAHKRCYNERYHEASPSREAAVLETQDRLDLPPVLPVEASTITPRATVANPLYLAWQILDPKQAVAEAIGEAAERYFEKHREHPNAVLLNERDWKRSGLHIGSVVHGCAVRVSFMIPDPGVLKVAKE